MIKSNQHIRYYRGADCRDFAAATTCVSRTPPQLLDNQSIRNYQLSIVEDGNHEMVFFCNGIRKSINSGHKWGEELSTSFQHNYERVIHKVINIQTRENALTH